jgi:hypothetical protein
MIKILEDMEPARPVVLASAMSGREGADIRTWIGDQVTE